MSRNRNMTKSLRHFLYLDLGQPGMQNSTIPFPRLHCTFSFWPDKQDLREASEGLNRWTSFVWYSVEVCFCIYINEYSHLHMLLRLGFGEGVFSGSFKLRQMARCMLCLVNSSLPCSLLLFPCEYLYFCILYFCILYVFWLMTSFLFPVLRNFKPGIERCFKLT